MIIPAKRERGNLVTVGVLIMKVDHEYSSHLSLQETLTKDYSYGFMLLLDTTLFSSTF